MANTSRKIETGLAQKLGSAETKGRQRFKKEAKRQRIRLIRRSRDPLTTIKQYKDYEY